MIDWMVRRWPLLVTIGAIYIFDVFSVFALHALANTSVHWAVVGAVVGVWWGQILLAVAITGLAGRTWIEGFSIGLTLILFGLAAFACSMLASGEVRSFSTDELVSLAAIPSLLFAACLPLNVFRQWRGWRFVSDPSEQNPSSDATSRSTGIEDLFLVTTVVAAALILARIAAVVWEVEMWSYWLYLTGGCILLSALTTVLIVPTCWIVYRIRRWQRLTVALVSLWLIGIGLSAAAIYVAGYLNGSRPIFKWEVAPVMAFAGALIAVLLIGLSMLRISGYTLGKRRKKSSEKCVNAAPIYPSLRPAIHTSRGLAVGFLVVAAIANIPVARVELVRRQQDQALAQLAQHAAERGGEIGVQSHTLTSLTAWPAMTDADLLDIDLSAVHTLSLAGSQVTDAILPELNTGRLFFLDLSHTQISEQSLAECDLKYLQELKLSSPQFTGMCFVTWPVRVRELDLSNSGVSDDTLVHVKNLMPLEWLDLSHTAVTDVGIAHLAGMRVESINISDTRITAEGIRTLGIAEKIATTPHQFSPVERLSLEASGVQVLEKSSPPRDSR